MLSFEPQIIEAHHAGTIDGDSARRLIALERREIFSVHGELRVLLWLGVSLIVAAVGLYLEENVYQLGHGAIIAIIGTAAAGCYLAALIMRRKATASAVPPPGIEYVLLLGALLLSADVGYFEAQYRLFGDAWTRYLLILAIVHGVAAYVFESKLVLSLSITALAGWLGIDRGREFLEGDALESGMRLMIAAAIVMAWRFVDLRVRRSHRALRDEPNTRERPTTEDLRPFTQVFEHFAANLAGIASLVWIFDGVTRWLGLLALLPLVAVMVVSGVIARRELLVIYGIAYGTIGIDGMVVNLVDEDVLAFLWLLVTTPIVIVLLFILHRRWGREW